MGSAERPEDVANGWRAGRLLSGRHTAVGFRRHWRRLVHNAGEMRPEAVEVPVRRCLGDREWRAPANRLNSAGRSTAPQIPGAGSGAGKLPDLQVLVVMACGRRRAHQVVLEQQLWILP